MRATLVSMDDRRVLAMVELRPCWLWRILGARATRIELVCRGSAGWCAVNSGKSLSDLPHSSKLTRALDFVPVAALPEMKARRSGSWLAPGSGE